ETPDTPPAEPKAQSETPAEPEPAPESGAEPKPDAKPESPAEPESKSAPHPSPLTPHQSPSPSAQALVGDHEEQQVNEAYNDDVDHEDQKEKSQEEPKEEPSDKQNEPPAEEQGVNYSLLSKGDLVKLLRDKLDNPGKGNIRKEAGEIKQAFFDKLSKSIEEKKKHFLEEGGDLEDFKPAEDPVETEMKELLHKYRGMKAEFTRQLEKTKQENLVKKQEILEAFRLMMEGQDSFEVTFRKFKDLQRQWFSAGIVPQQNLKDLWDSYNYFVEKFNDYVRINRDLRALDLKKNLELKIQLCEKTEELDKESNVVQAFKTLQNFHTRWREIGPVPRDQRDEIWDRFKEATSVINRKHQAFHSKMKESLHENLEKKVGFCERVEEIASRKYESHGAWAEKTKVVLEIQKNWKTIGYAPKKDNNAIYSRFRKACDIFFGNKAAYYAAAYDEQKDNLNIKVEIVKKAESLSDNQNWKETTTELIRLQKQWKEIGPVPRRESDRLWKRFRTACDTFFNNKSKYFEDIDSTFDNNLKSKEELIKAMDAFVSGDDQQENMKALEDFQTKFDEIGYVPSNRKDWIKEQFRLAQDRLLEKTGMSESERSLFRFRNRIRGMLQSPRSEMKINFERDKVINKLQQLRSDIGVWENNVGFFKQSDTSGDTIKGLHDQIDAAHERIRILELKIQILDDMENAN
ncbi:MAG: DUF349 domain-containing protein, partial [Bacteroidota bacterium]